MKVAFLHVLQDPIYARLMVESVRSHMDCEIVQITDMETPAIEGCTVMRSVDTDDNMTLFKMRNLSKLNGEVISLDTDILLQYDLSRVFSFPFEAAFTFRDGPVLDPDGNDISKLMPINCGVMFYRNASIWGEAVEWCSRHPVGWYADQLALGALWRRWDVLRLHCDNFNYTPKAENDDTSGRFAVHYKGKRKTWMLKEQS